MTSPLVLSLFPGLGLLDRAFEAEGFCVVRGPDPLWGGDVRSFHPPGGVFAGVIGGPPCQPFSPLAHMVKNNGHETRHENLIPEYERVVEEAAPTWFLMEEVRAAPLPQVPGFKLHAQVVNARHCGSIQHRVRRITFGTADGRALRLDTELFEPAEWAFTVTGDARERPTGERKATATGGKTSSLDRGGGLLPFPRMLELQGLPPDFLAESPFLMSVKRQGVGDGVPLPMGRAIAKAVAQAFPPVATRGKLKLHAAQEPA
jgi:DNA (cytosine-5)-methyltransferase 1